SPGTGRLLERSSIGSTQPCISPPTPGCAEADSASRFPQQLGAAVGGDRATRGPNAYAHLGSGLLCLGMQLSTSRILPGLEAVFADARDPVSPLQVDLSS